MPVLGCGFEEEPATRSGLDRGQPAPAGTGEEREHTRVHGDAERLHARALRDRPKLALDLERVSRVGHDEAVTGADGAAVREDLARAVGDVLARHLHEPERGDLDDVRLRPVSFELRR